MDSSLLRWFCHSGVDLVTDKKILLGPLNFSEEGGIIFNMMQKAEAAKNHSE
jgi:hypothetical protein